MGDWADDLANDWVKDIRAGLLDEPALAMKLRNIEVRGAVDAVKDLNRRLRDVLGEPEKSAGWEGE